MTGSRIVGPALAGLLIHTVGYGWCFVVDGLSYLAVLAGLALMRTSELRERPVTPRGKGQARAGFAHVRTVPELFVPLVMMALIGTLTFNFNVVMPLLVKCSLGGGDNASTVFYSVVSVGSLVGALASARRLAVELRHVVVSAIAFGGAMLLLAAAPSLALALFAGCWWAPRASRS